MQDKTWEKSKEEQKRSRDQRAQNRGQFDSPEPNIEENSALQARPKKEKLDPNVYSPFHYYRVDQSDSHDGINSPRAKGLVKDMLAVIDAERVPTPPPTPHTPVTPPSMTASIVAAGFSSLRKKLESKDITSPFTPFWKNSTAQSEQPDTCVTAIRNIKAFIENAIEAKHLDCAAALELLNREKTTVADAIQQLTEDDQDFREAYGEFFANAMHMIQTVETHQINQTAISVNEMRGFLDLLQPQRQEVVVKLF